MSKVLIVDDDKEFRDNLSEILRGGGYPNESVASAYSRHLGHPFQAMAATYSRHRGHPSERSDAGNKLLLWFLVLGQG